MLFNRTKCASRTVSSPAAKFTFLFIVEMLMSPPWGSGTT
jgi:hypothetical protein